MEEADAIVSVLSHEEAWELHFSEWMEDDPTFAHRLSLYSEVPGLLCSSESQSEGTAAAVPKDSVYVGSARGEVADLVGELFDCLQVNEEYARVFWRSVGDVGTPAFVEGLRSDRQLFVDSLVMAVVVDGLDLSWVRSDVDRACG